MEKAKRMATLILGWLADGKEALIRAEPPAETVTSADTQKTYHFGRTRFSFKDQAGEWSRPSTETIEITGFGKPPK